MVPTFRQFALFSGAVFAALAALVVLTSYFQMPAWFYITIMFAGFCVFHMVARNVEGRFLQSLYEEQGRTTSLEADVAKLTTELERAQGLLDEQDAKLGQADRLSDLGQLTATVSHEIRNPLSVIRTAVHVMRKKTDNVDVDITRPLDRAQRAVARCDDIVNDMLEYARCNELSTETVDSSQYLNDILDEQPMPSNITLVRELPEPGLEISIDRDRFRRAIINLISNAAEAIKDGGIEEGLISVTCLPDCPRRSIHIFNNGPAIPQEVLDRMYEPLYTTKSNGSGIGLPTVKKLIEQHGAELRCETGEGVGTTWTILLDPAAAAEMDMLGEDARLAA